MSLTTLETLRKENGGQPIKAALYARYSSDNQREESIEAQVDAIRAFAARENITIVEEYKDEAKTGTTDDRDDFKRMIADAKAKKFQLLLVHKNDRFSRNQYDSVIYRHELSVNGVRFLAVSQPLDENKPEEKLLDDLLTAMASFYSKNLHNEVLKGLNINAKKAMHTGGIPPLGYKVGKDHRLKINEKEAKAVRIIFKMVLEGYKYSEILNELRINGFKTKAGKDFGKNSLNAILHNPKYVGDFVYNRTYGKDSVTHKRNSHRERPLDEQIIVKDAIPAIISRDDFAKVQSLLIQRKRFAHVCTSKYLLTGRIVCGVCNSSFNGNCKLPNKNRSAQNPTFTYRCSNHSNKIDKNACDNKEINRDHLECFILSQIESWIFDPEIISSITKKYQDYAAQKAMGANQKLEKIKHSIKMLDEELENLTDKYVATDNPDLQQRLDKRIKAKDKLKKETEEAYDKEKAITKIAIPTKKEIKQFINKAKDQFKNKTLDELHDLVQLIVEKVVVYKDYVEITYNLIPGINQSENMKNHVKISREQLRLLSQKQTKNA